MKQDSENRDSLKQTDGEMHYRGVSDIHPPTTAKADPLGPLVERYLLRGDEEAMDRLVERTRPKLMAVARRIGAPQDAEDAVQGAYVALIRKRGTSLDAPVMPWLLTTVIRLAYRRKAKQRRQRELAARLAEPQESARAASRGPEDAVLGAERALVVRAAVASLPSRYRDPVVLRHLEGLTNKETAALLDVPEATLRTRLHRAATLLRSRVAPVLLASLLFLPWCVADAVGRLVPLTRPWLGKPLAAAALVGAVAVGSWALLAEAPSASNRAAAQRPATPPTTGSDAPVSPPGVIGSEPTTAEVPPPVEPQDNDAAPALPRGAGSPPPPPTVPAAAPDEHAGSARTRPPVNPIPELPGFAEIGTGSSKRQEPAGMVLMEGGHVLLGSAAQALAKALDGRPPAIRALFDHETPRHRVRVPSYWIAKHEVTNAQYLRFLQDSACTTTTHGNGLDNLEAIAARLVGQTPAERENPRQRVWRQLYEANRGAIWRAFSKAKRDVLVFGPDHALDLEATARGCRRMPLPPGLTLSFYSLRPPAHWSGLRPPAADLDHPVRYVSYNDAERLAEWAGFHVPTEAEWEWAARGPEGRLFPWGAEWAKDASRANWGGKITDASHETATLPVATLDDGRSWCGLHHMCGNVAEWTSSWFAPYPDFKGELHRYVGSWVKVIRGGSAGDGDALVLRSATRNFVGGGADAPPYPENFFRFVGFRLAGYTQPGRDHVGPILRRATRARRLKASALAAERYAGFVSHGWVEPDAPVANHVYVRGPSTAVVFVPSAHLLREDGSLPMTKSWRRPGTLRTTVGLEKASRGSIPDLVVGALHTDLPLEGVEVRDTDTAAPRKKKRRGLAKAPRTKPGRLEPGTYLVVLWFERLALTTPNLEFVCFLPEPEAKIPSVEVRPRLSKELGSPTLRPSLEADAGGLDFTVLLGGRHSPDKHVVRLRARMPYAKDAFHKAAAKAAWQRSTSGR